MGHNPLVARFQRRMRTLLRERLRPQILRPNRTASPIQPTSGAQQALGPKPARRQARLPRSARYSAISFFGDPAGGGYALGF